MTVAQLNKQNPGKWVMTDGVVFVAPLKNLRLNLTTEKAEAEKWSYADTLSIKLNYHRAVTKLNLSWVKA